MTDENPWAEHDARLRAEEEQQAKKSGVSVEDFRAAKHVGMDPVEFAAWRGVNTAADAAAVEDELTATAAAKVEAAKQAAVERERAKL